MADQLQLRGGTTSQTNSFTGANKEVTVDTNKKTLVIHDGATVGGFSLSGVAQPDGSIHFDDRNGVERMRLNSAGSLGIGADPKSGLHISGSGQQVSNLVDSGSFNDSIKLSTASSAFGSGGSVIFTNQQGENGAGIAAIKGFLLSGAGNTIGDLTFQTRRGTGDTSLTESMRLTSSGKLLIDTDTNFGGIQGKLHVNGSDGPVVISSQNTSQDAELRLRAGVGGGSINGALSATNALVFKTSNDSERMRLTSDGALLVGTTVKNLGATKGLTIRPDGVGSTSIVIPTVVQGFTNNPTKHVAITHFGTSFTVNRRAAEIGFLNENGNRREAGIYFSRSNPSVDDGTTVESARITSSGYLKADPAGSYLNVAGGSLINRPIHSVSSGANDVTFAVLNSNTAFNTTSIVSELTSSATGNHIRAATGNSFVFTVKTNGDVIGGAGSSFSDIKLKENITDATSKLDDINKVRFVNYCFKDGPRAGNKEFGVIAQELEEIFPNLIINTPDTEEVEVTKTETFETSEPVLDENGEPVLDENGEPVTTTKTEEREVTTTETRETGEVTKSVKYSVLTLMAVKALQEADAKINAQQSIIDDLLARVEALEKA